MISYDQKINKLFYYWLLSSFSLIFLMIIIGGLTRLTNSGLSITEWELFKGIFPPLNVSKWNYYFSLYKETTQYKLVNFDMSLNQFKIIFYWEYFHRILGRIIGLFFLIPLLFFYFSGKIKKNYIFICSVVMILIFFQGIIGWYMVKSGLVDNVTVSHYRLSLHLIIAILIISSLFWIILNFRKNKLYSFFNNKKNNFIFYLLIFLIFFQIILGAFVSGLDAGKIYQTWPLMNYSYFPDEINLVSLKDFFNFENHALVQFYHRNLAYLITIYLIIISIYILINKIKKLYLSLFLVIFFLFIQVVLGIVTLTSNLNLYLSSAHQICGLVLTLSVINLYYNHIN